MSLSELLRLVPAPAKPSEVGTLEKWRAVEQELGVVLPDDYRDFVFAYGSGLFASFFCVYNPFASDEYIALLPMARRICGVERDSKRDWPERVPYDIYPANPGILPWGNDENGNNYYWLTCGDPNSWTVLSDEVRGRGFREHQGSMTDYLVNVLLGKIKPLASGYPTIADRVFQVWPAAS